MSIKEITELLINAKRPIEIFGSNENEIKKVYRNYAKICHPDLAKEEEKALAEKMDSSSTERLYVFGNDDTSYPLEYYKLSFPIVIWATTNYEPTKEMWTWKSVDGTHSYTYSKNSHTIVVTGFDENYYYVNDPLQSSGNTKIEKEKLEKVLILLADK